ncbi:hypothetical protein HYY73_05345 [Candidatus Woesearchaeota archaeon]|nr:hypothetical protein [Candidatus Woesearchaeota archaeon]
MDNEDRIAECVGLWLAEGDNKSENEITFTNNCWKLVEFFHRNVRRLFVRHKPKIRIYIYQPNKNKTRISLKRVQVNYYLDERATKPYFI